jgi:peptidyl-dipeptidase A
MKLKNPLARLPILLLGSTFLLLSACCEDAGDSAPVNAEAAEEFVAEAEPQLLDSWIARERAGWVQESFITHDTNQLVAEASRKTTELTVSLAQEAARFNDLELDADLERKLDKLKLSLVSPAPADPDKTRELAQIETSMKSRFAQGTYCPDGEGGDCLSIDDIIRIHAESRDAAELLDVWQGWRKISTPMRSEFERYAELGNEGAKELGFADLGSMWRSKYDMDPDAFAAELDRLWEQVKPLYEALHCHVRARLADYYGSDVVGDSGPMPAHVLGNIWAQTWANVYDLVAPASVDPGYDLTALLQAEGVDEREMVRFGERFFTSLGFDPLPDSFWERSLFTRPADRDVVCHASAWDIDWKDDLRIKMCIKIDAEDFATIHHELGHNFYQRAYKDQPPLYTDSANDGFHEAVGDTIALSVTPAYLVKLGFLEAEPPADADVGLLLRLALDKVAFLPFGLLIDQWRWKVFNGEITPADYNAGWWELRTRYQGIVPPVERTEADFDPGAKYHVPANVPYTRYFLAHILQFQLHRALCEAAGDQGPLHRCSIYESAAAGERLADMLEMGASRPWPEALEAVTGQRDMDATAILDYFKPLADWLEEQNAGRTCGW